MNKVVEFSAEFAHFWGFGPLLHSTPTSRTFRGSVLARWEDVNNPILKKKPCSRVAPVRFSSVTVWVL